jgi:transcriptional regulator with XRE-family HTH domain
VIFIITNVIGFDHSITIVSKFADRLRHARTLRGFTQASLAKACGLSQGAIANYETKNRQTAKGIFKLADVLGVSPLWLSQGVGPMEPAPMSAALPPLANPTLAETGAGLRAGAWPFPGIPPDRFWSLPEHERKLIENTVASLIDSLGRN